MSVLAMMLLFIALQPGILLTLPAVGRRVFMSGKMSVQAVFVHALVFAVVLHFLRRGGYFEGFAGPIAPSPTVMKETEAFAKELGAPTIEPKRFNAIEKRVTIQLNNLRASVKSHNETLDRYAGKRVSESIKKILDDRSADLAKKKAEIALYEPIEKMLANKRAQLNTMMQKTITSVSASLPPAVVSQLKQSASQLSPSQIATLQKVVVPMVSSSASPSSILTAVKTIVPNISIPTMSGSAMRGMMSGSGIPGMMSGSAMRGMPGMMSSSAMRGMPGMMSSSTMSIAQAQAMAALRGFKF